MDYTNISELGLVSRQNSQPSGGRYQPGTSGGRNQPGTSAVDSDEYEDSGEYEYVPDSDELIHQTRAAVGLFGGSRGLSNKKSTSGWRTSSSSGNSFNSRNSASDETEEAFETPRVNNTGRRQSPNVTSPGGVTGQQRSGGSKFNADDGLNTARIKDIRSKLKPTGKSVFESQSSTELEDATCNAASLPNTTSIGWRNNSAAVENNFPRRSSQPNDVKSKGPISKEDNGNDLNSVNIKSLKSNLRSVASCPWDQSQNRQEPSDSPTSPSVPSARKASQLPESGSNWGASAAASNSGRGKQVPTAVSTPAAPRAPAKGLAGKVANRVDMVDRTDDTHRPQRITAAVSKDRTDNRIDSTLNNGLNRIGSRDSNSSLSAQSWYFGAIDREECEVRLDRMLNENGSYLVRDSQRGGQDSPYTLCVVYARCIYHLHIRRRSDGKFSIGLPKADEKIFNSVVEMISFHQNNQIELIGDSKKKTSSGKVTLKKSPQRR